MHNADYAVMQTDLRRLNAHVTNSRFLNLLFKRLPIFFVARRYADMPMPCRVSVHPSVSMSDTFAYSMETAKPIFKHFAY